MYIVVHTTEGLKSIRITLGNFHLFHFREGKHQVQLMYGTSEKDIYKNLSSSKEDIEKFQSGMEDAWSLYGQDVICAFDLSSFNRVCDVGGDFFNDPIPEADLYILARILHNQDDEKCVALLTKLHKACKPGGGVLLVETVLNEDRSGPLAAHIYSIVMLLVLEGKERTLSEYSTLLVAAGFKDVQFKKGQHYDAVYGRK
nr:PREDICTED: acetylserotonin O-methyltransferase isoform X2 [Anolis carolinensis]|eukprot:XP_008101436.1 PREDICTED: acetylserotonin O-methyltransferase isoform X2 [Anolis carolinensis]